MPVFPYPENAAQALQLARRHARFRDRAVGEAFTLPHSDRKAVRAVVDRVVASQTVPTWLEPHDVELLLRAVGIAYAAAELVAPAGVRVAAERLGFPLVAKLSSPDVLHKSDVGGVVMGLRTGAEVEAAAQSFVDIASRLGARLDGVLLQRQVDSAIEAFVGVTTDPTFGPLVACGLGGTMVELLRDVAFRITPVTDLDAREMLASLRTRALLQGFRGRPAGDEEALVATVMRVSALVEAAPEIAELDVNPIEVLPPGRGVVAVDARIRVTPLGLRASGSPQPATQPPSTR
jgi:acyl-CoA synthetase (NDP forming)